MPNESITPRTLKAVSAEDQYWIDRRDALRTKLATAEVKLRNYRILTVSLLVALVVALTLGAT